MNSTTQLVMITCEFNNYFKCLGWILIMAKFCVKNYDVVAYFSRKTLYFICIYLVTTMKRLWQLHFTFQNITNFNRVNIFCRAKLRLSKLKGQERIQANAI